MSGQWKLTLIGDKAEVDAFEEALEPFAPALLAFEVDEARGRWSLEAIGEDEPDRAGIATALAEAARRLGIAAPDYTLEPLEPRDWLRENLISFPPLPIGRFFVHGCHVPPPNRSGRVAILVDAATAFGSGEHPTTMGCLLALHALKRLDKRPARVLDMGCGSGILSIGAAKIWPIEVDAVDIDPESVRVTRFNAVRNRVAAALQAQAGDGYRAPIVRHGAPYDLILSNILAKPLMKMAPALDRALARGGVAVLSGLLVKQEAMVLSAHRSRGLCKVASFRHRGWSALVLRKSGAGTPGRIRLPRFTPRGPVTI
jgi:ribosomal protein L11 methyltransferase